MFAKDAYTAYSVYRRGTSRPSGNQLEEKHVQRQRAQARSDGPEVGPIRSVGPRGGKGNEVTVTKGEPMPPSPKPGMTYDLTDPSKKSRAKESNRP